MTLYEVRVHTSEQDTFGARIAVFRSREDAERFVEHADRPDAQLKINVFERAKL